MEAMMMNKTGDVLERNVRLCQEFTSPSHNNCKDIGGHETEGGGGGFARHSVTRPFYSMVHQTGIPSRH